MVRYSSKIRKGWVSPSVDSEGHSVLRLGSDLFRDTHGDGSKARTEVLRDED